MKTADQYNNNAVLKEAYELGYGLAIGIVNVNSGERRNTMSFKLGCSVTSVASTRCSTTILFTAEIDEEVIEYDEVTETALEEGTTANELAADIALVTTIVEYSAVVPPTEAEISTFDAELDDCDNADCTVTAEDTSEGGGGDGDDAGLIAGIVAGLVGAIAVVVVAVVLFIKYRAGSNKGGVDLQELDLEGNNKDVESTQTDSEDLTAPLSPKTSQAAKEAAAHSQI